MYWPKSHSYRCAYKLHTVPCTGLRVTATGVLINYIPYRVQAYEVMIESVYIRHWTHWTFVVCVAGSTCWSLMLMWLQRRWQQPVRPVWHNIRCFDLEFCLHLRSSVLYTPACFHGSHILCTPCCSSHSALQNSSLLQLALTSITTHTHTHTHRFDVLLCLIVCTLSCHCL